LKRSYKKPEVYPGIMNVRKPSFLTSRTSGNAPIRATWLGHACFFVEFSTGLRVIFDPVFSERCSPLSFAGPKRYSEVPCQVEDMPAIDAVIISHCHYDHLDYPTIMKIYKQNPKVHFFVPLKNKNWFIGKGIKESQVTELDWWEKATIEISPDDQKVVYGDKNEENSTAKISARISCLPSQHIGNRGPFDRGKTLWGSWSVESGGKSVWFAGDTGYRSVPELPEGEDDYGEGHNYPHCPAFAEIGQYRGPFDLGLIPIGAYYPRHLMSPVHANPMDAVNIFKDTQCKKALAMHWGTWILTNEDVLEPPKLLKEALQRNKIPEEGIFDVCELGESREFS
jgi:L-ascorbate metabolism protein UlaG (beta-lactamase superfamily)